MTDPPQIERLDYYNGQRLEAADLRLEQRYHLDMRRMLNRELFTPGVVSGLEVAPIPDDTTHLQVGGGLALDPLGRELVIAEQAIALPGQPPPAGRDGYFLVALYGEERRPAGEDPCLLPGSPRYALIREQPELLWTERLPMHAGCTQEPGSIDCAVVLAFVRMKACKLEGIVVGVRQLAHPAHTSQTSAIAFEGEKDIDTENSKVLHFVPRGGSPSSVMLYLWGGQFSSLYYTQMGHHSHNLTATSVVLSPHTEVDHKHPIPVHTHVPVSTTSLVTDDASRGHRHNLLTRREEWSPPPKNADREPKNTILTQEQSGAASDPTEPPKIASANHIRNWAYASSGWVRSQVDAAWERGEPFVSEEGKEHKHSYSVQLGNAVNPGSPDPTATAGSSADAVARTHTHSLELEGDIAGTGSPEYKVVSSPAYFWLDHLNVALDGVDVTPVILEQLGRDWKELGNRREKHPLNSSDGTGPIDLLEVASAVGLTIEDKPHRLEFSVASGGGKLLYNLYVQ